MVDVYHVLVPAKLEQSVLENVWSPVVSTDLVSVIFGHVTSSTKTLALLVSSV